MRDKAKDIARPYNVIKGRVTEGIVRELFVKLGMNVYANGYEITHPHFAQDLKDGKVDPKQLEGVRSRPDFMIRDSRLDESGKHTVYFVEVKYRQKSCVQLSELEPYKDSNIIFIFVDHVGFWCATQAEIEAYRHAHSRKTLPFDALTPLRQHDAFAFDDWQKETIRCFRYMIQATLKNFDENKELETKIEKQLLKEEF